MNKFEQWGLAIGFHSGFPTLYGTHKILPSGEFITVEYSTRYYLNGTGVYERTFNGDFIDWISTNMTGPVGVDLYSPDVTYGKELGTNFYANFLFEREDDAVLFKLKWF